MIALIATAYTTTAHAQIDGGALEYMLQRPRVAKQWQHKKPFDHLFVDGGIGTSVMGARKPEFDLSGGFNIGNWVTPEHGVRLNINTGEWSTLTGSSFSF